MENNMPKRYLWAISDEVQTLPPGTLIADRYLFRGSQILLDTQQSQLPELPDEIPDPIIPYLRLFPERLHVPQIYGMISPKVSRLNQTIWLLEQAPIHPLRETLTPQLIDAWANATAIRQLNWLWQIAQLWSPFQRQQVASSLLNPNLLYVSGSIVQLLEIQLDSKSAKLSHLGKLWQQWILTAHPSLQNFLEQLSDQMIRGQLRSCEQLTHQLDQALVVARQSISRKITITTATETGPVRAQNEDACYPQAESLVDIPANAPGLAIVCDGIGGQEGGEIAAQLAIDVLTQQVQPDRLHLNSGDPYGMMSQLQRSVNLANDQICQRNDRERRQGRERMGTTLIMGLAHHHELYITHVGDSRAYWITTNGCYQITLDDDVASREVRLGYAFYQDALQQRASGALIQALGITNSANLHPTISRFPIDEDCLILLCSDGLSDKDRVEGYWQQEILPILTGETDIIKVRDRLVEIANTRNGHDNVTVALMHFQVYPHPEVDSSFQVSVPPVPEREGEGYDDDDDDSSGWNNSQLKTQFITPPSHSKQKVRRLSLGILLLLIVAGFIFYILRALNTSTPDDNGTVQPPSSEESPVPTPTPTQRPFLELKSLIEVGSPSVTALPTQQEPMQIFEEFGQPLIQGEIPPGSVIQILGKQSTPQAGIWLEVKICSVPPPRKENSLESSDRVKDLSEFSPDESIEQYDSFSEENIEDIEIDREELPVTTPDIITLTPGSLGWIKEQVL